ncbi:PilZ domain-containing protein [Novosphingobium sp. SL115]|uniref:PilZ domain-containing protein n=1 Tax=Novosphingobium sp. SL115 TaxID=2995150 RepID=UPI002276BE01|nr:PilZ domain-containing protein [Novosphingobium sp. SL115]MCY1671303.1 PilZ domain-containing protein [Novosphingobium sp. SL115]
MWRYSEDTEFEAKRRAPRVGIELPVRCKCGAARSTVILKDLNQYGARIEGLERLRIDEPIHLMLPGLQPKLAFVVWSRDRVSGLEFEHRLHDDVFQSLVSDFAIRHYREGHPPKVPPIRHAA